MKTLLISFILILSLTSRVNSQPYFQKIISDPIAGTSNYSNMAAWADYDNDGDPDVVISAVDDSCGDCPGALMMFRNNGNGGFVRVTGNAITNQIVVGSGLSWTDYDNDGLLDLFVCGTYLSKNYLFHNDGNGIFTKVITGPVVNDVISSSQACDWIDYNKDGWLDLFVSNRSGTNFFYENNGDGTFTKITTGNIVTDPADSRGCAWGDYNNDGWHDLFVLNYTGEDDFLYRNNGDETFTKITDVPMVHDGFWGASCGWFDYNNDGWIDLYVTGDYNRLYRNNHDGTFSIVNGPLNVNNSYGFSVGDFDNDGWTDLFRVNVGEINSLFKNNGGIFSQINGEIPGEEGYNSVASTMIDYNKDGNLDLFVTNRFNNLYNFLYKNNGGSNNYIIIQLVGNENIYGIGARMKVVSNGMIQIRDITAGSGWGSQNSFSAHFGVGSNEILDSIIVSWPSGMQSVMTGAGVNQSIKFYETANGIQTTGIKTGITQTPSGFSLSQNYPNPFNPSTSISFQIPSTGLVQLKVFDILGNDVATILNQDMTAGYHTVKYVAEGIPSGIYFYRLNAGTTIQTKQMMIVK